MVVTPFSFLQRLIDSAKLRLVHASHNSPLWIPTYMPVMSMFCTQVRSCLVDITLVFRRERSFSDVVNLLFNDSIPFGHPLFLGRWCLYRRRRTNQNDIGTQTHSIRRQSGGFPMDHSTPSVRRSRSIRSLNREPEISFLFAAVHAATQTTTTFTHIEFFRVSSGNATK